MARIGISLLYIPIFSLLPVAVSQADSGAETDSASHYSDAENNPVIPQTTQTTTGNAATATPIPSDKPARANVNAATIAPNTSSSSSAPPINPLANAVIDANRDAVQIDPGVGATNPSSNSSAITLPPVQIAVDKQAAITYMNTLNQKLLDAGTPQARAQILDQPETQFTCGLNGNPGCGTNRDLLNHFPQIVASYSGAGSAQNSATNNPGNPQTASPTNSGNLPTPGAAPMPEPNQPITLTENGEGGGYLGLKPEASAGMVGSAAPTNQNKGASAIVPENFIANLEKQLAQVEESKEALALIQQIGKTAGDKDLENLQSLEGLGDLQLKAASATMPSANADSLQADLAHAATAPLSKHDELLQTLGSIVARQKYKNSPNRMPANGIGATLLAEDLFQRTHRAHTRFYENFYKNKS